MSDVEMTTIRTHMVEDVSEEDIWNSRNLTLGIRRVIFAFKVKGKREK